MWLKIFVFLLTVVAVLGALSDFQTQHFRVGIEYDTRVHTYIYVQKKGARSIDCVKTIYRESLPLKGGSDRYRHRNNYDPFMVAITATVRRGYVISFLDVTATIDAPGEVDFQVLRGRTGSRSMTFQLVTNNTDFISYTYKAYGIREEEYRKVTSVAYPGYN